MPLTGTAATKAHARSPWLWVPSLYFAEGVPYAVVTVVAVVMFKRLGADNTSTALLTSWLYLPWVVKPLWSPVVDAVATKRLWVWAMQLLMGAAFALVGLALVPSAGSWMGWAVAALLLVAFASATHDIAADGFYIEALSSHTQSRMVGFRTTFYRLAMLFAQGALVWIAGRLELHQALGARGAWQVVMWGLGGLFAAFAVWHHAVLPRPAPAPASAGLAGTFARAFASFFRKPGIGFALAFMLLFRLPEAQLLKMIIPFLLDDPAQAGGLGLTTSQVGLVYGTVGMVALLAGGIIGGLAASRTGLRRCMVPMAWTMSLSCLAFVALSLWSAPPLWAVYVAVALEQLGYGFGNTAYMLYLLWFSRGPMATSHYAFATGFMALGMMLPGMAAGALQEAMGYPLFFAWTMACCVATIILAVRANVPPSFGLASNAHE